MKKFCITFTLFLIIILSGVAVGFKPENDVHAEYLRIHIRANSNEVKDQDVKYYVKDEIVKLLTPIVATCTTKKQAEQKIRENLSTVEEKANFLLSEIGFLYKAKAKIKNEEFPTRL